MSLRIKKNDRVQVITGEDKGKVARVLYIVSGRVWFPLLVKAALLAGGLPVAVLLIKRMMDLGAAVYYCGLVSAVTAIYLIDITSRIKRTTA